MNCTETLPTSLPSTVSATDNVPAVTATPEPSPGNLRGKQETSKPAKTLRSVTKEKENAPSSTRLSAAKATTAGTATKPATAKPLTKPASTAPRVTKTSTLSNRPSSTVPRKSTPALSAAKPSTAQPFASGKASATRPLSPAKTDTTNVSRLNATKATVVKTAASIPPASRTKPTSERVPSAIVAPKPSPSKTLPKKPVLTTSSAKSANGVSSSADNKSQLAELKVEVETAAKEIAELKVKVETTAKEIAEKDMLLAQKEAELNDLKAQIAAAKMDATMVERLQVQAADPIEEAARLAVDVAFLKSKENEFAELTQKYSALECKYLEEMVDANAKFEEALNQKEEEHANAMHTLQDQLAHASLKAEIAHNDSNDVDRERESEMQKREAAIICKEKELAQMTEELKLALEDQRRKYEEERKTFEESCESATTEKLTLALEDQRQKYEEERKTFEESCESALTEKLKLALEDQRRKYEEERKTFEASCDSASTEKLKLALEDQQRKYEEEHKKFEESSEFPIVDGSAFDVRLAEAVEAARQEARNAACNELTAAFERKLEEQRAAMKEDQESAVNAQKSEIQQLEEELRIARSEAAQISEKQTNGLELEEDVNVCNLAEMEANHKKEMDLIYQSLEQKLKQKDDDICALSKQVEYVTKAHAEDVQSIRNRCSLEVNEMTELLTAKEKDFNDNINTLQAENMQFLKMIHQLQQDLVNKVVETA